MRFHNTIVTILYAAARRSSVYVYKPAKYFCCCCCCCCCCCSVVLLYCCCCSCCCLQLLAAAVRHRVPDGKLCCCGSLHLIRMFSFSSFKHNAFSMYPLAVLSHLQRRFFTYSTYNTSSAFTGMRGAKTGVSPPRRSDTILQSFYYSRVIGILPHLRMRFVVGLGLGVRLIFRSCYSPGRRVCALVPGTLAVDMPTLLHSRLFCLFLCYHIGLSPHTLLISRMKNQEGH